MKKKITFLALDKDFSGKTREIVALINSLVSLYDIKILFLKESNTSIFIDSKINVQIYSPKALESRKFYQSFFKDSEVIVATDDFFCKPALKYGKCKKVFWTHKNAISLEDKYISKFDIIVVPNKKLKASYDEFNKNVLVICDGIDLPKQDIVAKGNNLIFIGNLTKNKNIEMLLNVFLKVIKKIKTNLVIIGEGEERTSIEAILKKKNISNVFFKGGLTKDEVVNELLESALYISCGDSDSTSLSMLEAMSYGVPVITFSSSLNDDTLITDDINGYVILNKNEDEMYEKIIEVLSDSLKKESLCICAKEKAMEYDINSLKIEWIKIL